MTREQTAGTQAKTPGGCEIDIRIDARGDVHIHNCAPPCRDDAPRPPGSDCPPPPRAEGACVPLGLGCKPKQSKRSKLERIAARSRVPSVLAASFFQTGRRFLRGAAPATDFERAVYPVFTKMSPEVRAVLACAVENFESGPPDLRNAGLDTSLTADPDAPVDTKILTGALVAELGARAADAVLGNPIAVEEERPGRNRFFEPEGEFFETQLQICRVNGLRVASYRPALTVGDYQPAEVQQRCELVLGNDGQIGQNCTVQTADCPGNILVGGSCARVPDVAAGDAVLLQGVNFMNVDTTVRLRARVGTAGTDVEAHVFGDVTTPVFEEVPGGPPRLIRDCRVDDRLTFVVPESFPPGVYEVQLVMPNNTGFPSLGPNVLSNVEYVNVVPPSTARFQIVAERLRARVETAPASFGSDEVALTVLAAPLLPDGTVGSLQRLDRRFDDVDSGENRGIESVVFANDAEVVGVALSVVGFEVDSERAFRLQIESFSEAFMDYLTRAWEEFKKELTAGAGAAIKAFGLGWGSLVVGAAALLAVAVVAVVARWAPADLIMDDAVGFSAIDLAALTNADLPQPAITHFDSPQGLGVNRTPLGKTALTYREFREYASDAEESRYELYLRYNRTA